MKVLVTGYGGQLGRDVVRALEARGVACCGTTRGDVDLTDGAAVGAFIAAYRPDAVIHCAAYTAVDRAEDEAALCAAVNAGGTESVARACRESGAKLIYISTDYVFPGDGDHFYETGDTTGPLGVYGRTKLAGEAAVRALLTRYFIVRVSWVFGANGNNFVKTMLRLGRERDSVRVVDDQIGSPTYTPDLAELLADMVATERYGTYHATNEGVCSWAQFAREIFCQAQLPAAVEPIASAAYPTRARRPLNSRLSKASLDAAGFVRLPRWQDALARYLAGGV